MQFSKSGSAAMAVFSFLLLSSPAARADQWRMAPGPLVTRWAKDVSPDHALPEYPRPQMVRKRWLNLNGLWDYAISDIKSSEFPDPQGVILVPYPIEAALSGVMKPLKPDQLLWYRRTFEVPKAWAGKRVLLHFGAVDWEATVRVNGEKVAMHRGGYDGFTADVTDALRPTGPQEIVVRVWDPTDAGGYPTGKQALHPLAYSYTASSGIWQTVWLEPVGNVSIDGLEITPDVDAGLLRLVVRGRGTDGSQEVQAEAREEGRPVAQAAGKPGEELRLPIPRPRLWSPESPFLYDLKVTLKQGAETLDAVESYFGMRKIGLGRDDRGILRPMLNGKFTFQAGPLDQGFWPDGIYTAPTDEALRFDVEMTKKLGFNMTRKHVKIEPERWYYWCDKLGLPVWQDMVSAGNRTEDNKKQFEVELRQLLAQRGNHPSIAAWIVFNEGWGQFDTPRLTKMVKRLDPTRLVNDASGWVDKGVGDVHDVHVYPGPDSPQPELQRIAVLGEFGGLGLKIDGHTWSKDYFCYRECFTPRRLAREYGKLWHKAYRLQNTPGLSAAIYTQLTDVETEGNGLLTYDRAVVKIDAEQGAAINRGLAPPPPKPRILTPTAQQKPVTWRYTLEKPSKDWFRTDFKDSAWKQGPAGFGTAGTPGAVVRTAWKTGDVWLRRKFTVQKLPDGDFCLLIHHDEDAEVYINGVLVIKLGGYTTGYEEVDLSAEAKSALREGENVIAVHCKQTGGGQYLDAGLISYPAE
ncbi:MAG: glycoside hydrolase family 2 [Pirellulales bacterium]|nr:glycoside hydrolase family 2 [Pirellulales bacterium]